MQSEKIVQYEGLMPMNEYYIHSYNPTLEYAIQFNNNNTENSVRILSLCSNEYAENKSAECIQRLESFNLHVCKANSDSPTWNLLLKPSYIVQNTLGEDIWIRFRNDTSNENEILVLGYAEISVQIDSEKALLSVGVLKRNHAPTNEKDMAEIIWSAYIPVRDVQICKSNVVVDIYFAINREWCKRHWTLFGYVKFHFAAGKSDTQKISIGSRFMINNFSVS